MKVTFKYSEDSAEHIKTFYFEPEQPVKYLAGQFTELRLPHDNPDDRGDKRWFTLSSSPTDKLLTITTKFADKSSSFKSALLMLKPGTVLDFADAMGDFVLPKDASIPLLFVAGGMGITPFHSIIKYLTDQKEQRDIRLLYSVSSPGEVAFRELFDAYDGPVTYLTNAPNDDWHDEVGKLSPERILQEASAKERRIYISGPEPMVESFIDDLYKLGIPMDQLIGDYFPGYPDPTK